MKKLLIYLCFFTSLTSLWGCMDDEGNYPGGRISPYIAILDVRGLYPYYGKDVTLTREVMFGATHLSAVVTSDHRGKNTPAGMLIVQDERRISQLRGIAIDLGADAGAFVPGDSVLVDLQGGLLTKKEGILQITGLTKDDVKKVTSVSLTPVRLNIGAVLADPDKFECVFGAIVKGSFDPTPVAGETLAGDKIVNDGFGSLTLRTDAAAAFSAMPAPVMANYYGYCFNTTAVDTAGNPVPLFRCRIADDIIVLPTPEKPAAVITGFVADPDGTSTTDANYEYIQLLATRDIDFAVTPHALVTTNNAGGSTPTGYPVNGWATGDLRTYKLNLTSGTVKKGEFFYVGGSNKRINGAGSTDISTANWIKAYNYNGLAGEGFGTKTGNLLANSGNAFGMALFSSTTVTATSIPVDMIFVHNGGNLYTPGPPERGYRVGNTDMYDIVEPIQLTPQPYFNQGTNTKRFAYNSTPGGFYQFTGEFDAKLGRWSKARVQNAIKLELTSSLEVIEAGPTVTKLKN
ncbi:DUF5689 domain-containing protein [Chitinophaga lutea]